MFLHIAVPRPLDDLFIYQCPPELEDQASAGKRVIAPFGRQKITGYIIDTSVEMPANQANRISAGEVKSIHSILDTDPLIDETMLSLCKWASDYYMFPVGMVLKTAFAGIPEGKAAVVSRKKFNVLDSFREVSDGVSAPPGLTTPQKEVLHKLSDSIAGGNFAVHLLHGITGSGKTEVYMSALQEVVRKGRRGIVLVPEIAITPQLIMRFVLRFGDNVAVLHSGLTEAERRCEWLRIKEGIVDVVIGVRSAVFAPVDKLGLIVVDEEHEHTYKQEEGFRFNARDVAVMRAKLSKAVVILGSATPSLESYYNTDTGKYSYLSLPDRINKLPLPSVQVVDLRKKYGFSIFTDELLNAMKSRIERGEQSLLFLNRRGFSPFLLCLDCGHSPECPNCSVSLTYHKSDSNLCCHYCDYIIKPPDTCTECKGSRWKAFGAGTERVEEELKKLLPDARIVRMDRDTTTKRGSHMRIFQSMKNKDADILIGTQMVTKGLDLPDITLVGVLLADATLHLPDFRSGERTFQFLTQVAGRAGRGSKGGEVIVQTFNPEHYAIRHASGHDFKGFYNDETSFRKALGYPPFKRLARFLIKGNNKEHVEASSEWLKKILERNSKEGIDILGPVSAPFSKIRGKHRWHIIIKGKNSKTLNGIIRKSLDELKRQRQASPAKGGVPGMNKSAQVEVDIDPLSLL
ncbi:MAG: primosomal protein N' [Nitrospirae bacterium]|nr:primosomal protein N' [Nitrospirota bacterium]